MTRFKIQKSVRYVVVLFLLISCNNDNSTDSINNDSVNQRSFFMGFTAFPYDATIEAQNQSYQYVKENGDILLTHFDHGVPWNEILNDQPFPTEIQKTIDEAVQASVPNQKIMLTATATDINRNGLAKYWNNDGTHQTLPAPWNGYQFDESDVILAYTKYCKRIIDAIQPDYFAYGIEINAGFTENTTAFNAYLILAENVYNALKSEYPNLPIFLTFQDQSFNKTKQELHRITKELLKYSDMIAVSTYPFWQYQFPTRDANPSLLANDWLKEMRELAPNKPFAISETGYIAENLVIPEFNINIKGTEQWQADYAQKLCNEANKLNAEFILWFIYRDYDLLYNNTPDPPAIFKVWKDNGLLDENGNKRSIHTMWDTWKEFPKN